MTLKKAYKWRVGWYIRGMDGVEVVPELNWGQCTEDSGGGAAVRQMAQYIAVSLERHAEELDKRGKLPEAREPKSRTSPQVSG